MKNSAANLEEMPTNIQVQKYTPFYTHVDKNLITQL